MRIRTVYFKVDRLVEVVQWWQEFLGTQPTKAFPQWHEFRIGEMNLGFLKYQHASDGARSVCVPVFQVPDDEVAERINQAKRLGARAVLEGEDHPDYPKTAAVLVDPFGNEFEVTCYEG